MIGDYFVLDAVTHAYNQVEENYAEPVFADAMVEMAYALGADAPDPRYAMDRDQYIVDWTVDGLANLLFAESATDVAVMHPLLFASFKDGYSSIAKAAEALEKYPQRFIGAYAFADPLKKDAAAMLREQADMWKPLGMKLYPTSWTGDKFISFRMDDPKIAYPMYEEAQKLGINTVAVHKAVPIGPFAVGDAFNPNDLEGAATDFPDINFEIVHGGLAFLEETGWLLARFGNIAINMEIQNILIERRPHAFAEVLLGLCRVGGADMLKRMFWGSGGTLAHPQPALAAFENFKFPEEMLDRAGLFKPIAQITEEDKRNILAGTYARLHDLDLDAIRNGIKGDKFDRMKADGPRPPLSTISHGKAAVDA